MKRPPHPEHQPRTAQSLTIALCQDDLEDLTKLSNLTNTHPSTLAYHCFKTGLASLLATLRKPWAPSPNSAPSPDQPKRNAKYVTIYITEADLSELHSYPQLYARSFPRRSVMRRFAADLPPPPLTTLAYSCFRKGLAFNLADTQR
jgi:hypothetical protein